MAKDRPKHETVAVPAAFANRKFRETSFMVWRPNEIGDDLTGIYQGYTVVAHPNGDFRAHRVINAETGELQSCSGAVLDKALENTPEGAEVCIIWAGWGEGSEGREMRLYRVLVAE